MVAVNINQKDWDEFLKQSIDMKTSASKRISDFIKKELKKSINDLIPTKKLDKEGRVR